MKKLTTEEFIEKSKLIWGDKYDYSLADYVNSSLKIDIICKKHGVFTQRASAHLDGQGCMECRLEKRRTGLDAFLSRSYEIHGDEYDYSLVTEYVNSLTKVDIICKKHGVFRVKPDNHTNRKQGCPDCKKLGLEKFIEKSNIKHNNKYDYSLIKEYVNNKQKVNIICKEHGVFNQRMNDHMIGGAGCPECAIGRVRLSTEYFIKRSKEIHNNRYTYSSNISFKSNKDKVEINCREHGIFLQKVNSHLSGQGCPSCKTSKGEVFIKDFLIKNCISFIQQYKFEDCRDKKQLPFDFYLKNLNICIEFNGKQHYEPIEYFGGINSLKSQIKRDLIKREYCENNNILLIIIRYDDDIYDILDNYFLG